jgi:hypothetical protein
MFFNFIILFIFRCKKFISTDHEEQRLPALSSTTDQQLQLAQQHWWQQI